MNQQAESILSEVKKVIVGKDNVLLRALTAILSRGHILLEDVPGVGKTTLALAFSRAMGIEYRRIQFTPDVVPSDIVGFSIYDKATGALQYKPGAVMCNLLLADEINRTSSKTQAALLEVMEERQVTIDGETHPLPDPFIVIATQNPVGTAGTQLLPQAQLDRFMVRLKMGYPDFNSQVSILRDRRAENPLSSVAQAVDCAAIQRMQREAEQLRVTDSILEYITHLAQATRESPVVQLGVSPRGALSTLKMAQAHAYIQGRDYVLPEDAAAVFGDVCAHRLILSPKAKLAGKAQEDVIREVLSSVRMPLAGA
ncbi:MAG: MoxR family ATPase [Candidatus Faecivicinus sp.]|nr:MoxR family ATPase [Candidatus Faecivicinus sp.]